MKLFRVLGSFLFAICAVMPCVQAHEDKYEKFPHESCLLYELEHQSKILSDDGYKKAKKLIQEFEKRTQEDPWILHLKMDDAKKYKAEAGKYHAPFDYNRTGREIKGLYICASDIHLDEQRYVLAECPKTIEDASNYYEAALAEHVRVFVSAHESTECKGRCNHFWEKSTLEKN